ncbi:MAG: dephospho-CoA kinase [Planctomycetaceae bacterium]|nr:dephospho-CoA kinase [Planctomycetaceae bacterium]
MHSIPVIGLVGGVGSGKSSVARAAAEFRSPSWPSDSFSQSDIVIISGDSAGHEVLRDADVRQSLGERFGPSILDETGEIIRPALGRLVFGEDKEAERARRDLEAIVHPKIRQRLEQQIRGARSNPQVRAILLDAAILLESGWSDVCDAVVFIDTPQAERLKRVAASRGWTADQLARREASQWSLEKKKAASDFVIKNEGDLQTAGRELAVWIDRLLKRLKP